MYQVIDPFNQQPRGIYSNQAAAYIAANVLSFEEKKVFVVIRLSSDSRSN